MSEVVKLKTKDFDFDNLIGWVRNGKGGKDRPFIIPIMLKEKLRMENLDGFLFKGRKNHLSVRSAQNIIKDAGKIAGIQRHVHPNMLRHSFTTHLLQNNEDISTVQALLGHAHPETTLGYSHAKKFRSNFWHPKNL